MNTFKSKTNNRTTANEPADQLRSFFPGEDDHTTDELLANMNSTPLGKLLSMIAALPEIRQEKVKTVRRQLNEGHYDVSTNLDTALDMILEEFLTE